MERSGTLEAAREAYAAGDWPRAHSGFERARDETDLSPEDLDALSRAAWWLGRGAESMAVSEDVYRRLEARGERLGAAMQALALSLEWASRGDLVVSSGWLNRARRLLRDLPRGPEHGYLAYLEAGLAMELEGDPAPAASAAAELFELARGHDDPALTCFGRVLSGLAEVRSGQTAAGFGDLDEAMLPVLAGRVSALWSGDIYCTVIHLCHQLGDLARMRAWTDALGRWAGPLSRTFMYAGITRVHQLQLVSAEGGWDAVEAEIGERSEELVDSHGWMAGAGYYELGEVRRLRGDPAAAQRCYDQARALGVDPQPGEALLLGAAGRRGEALATLRASLGEQGTLGRARLLLPAVQLALAEGDAAFARAACDELARTASFYASPGLRAWADHARGCLLLAEGRWAEARAHLEAAAQVYREQRVRYATAQVHEDLARARRGLGEPGAADADVATALAIYRRLRATPDVERLDGRVPGGLTSREAEVLACIASGASNRQVAEALFISEKTVSRHLANIFLKAGVSTRTAAAAWAREQGVAPRPVG